MEKIILASVLTKNVIAVGKRHDDILADIFKLADYMPHYTAGFITSEGRFVDRAEAREIAIKAGQVKDTEFPQLYSEDLW